MKSDTIHRHERKAGGFVVLTALVCASECATHEEEEPAVAACEARIQRLESDMHLLSKRVQDLEERLEEKETEPVRIPAFPDKPSTIQKLEARCEEAGGRYWLTPKEAAQIRDNKWGVTMSGRIIPYVEQGQVKGFKIYGMRSDTFLHSCGFHNGDMVHEINGIALDSPEDFFLATEQICEEGEARIEILRRGEEMNLFISVKK